MKLCCVGACVLLVFRAVLGHLLGPKVGELLESSDKVCNDEMYTSSVWVARLSGVNKFTGIRVFKVYSFRVRPFKKVETVSLVYCENGKKTFEQRMAVDEGSGPGSFWGTPVVIRGSSKNVTFQLARKEGYIDHDHSFALPGTLVGGVFHCLDDSCADDTTEPILPLYSNTHKKIWLELLHGHEKTDWTFEKYIPVLSTPNDSGSYVQKLRPLFKDNDKSRSSSDILLNLFKKVGKSGDDGPTYDQWYNHIKVNENYF